MHKFKFTPLIFFDFVTLILVMSLNLQVCSAESKIKIDPKKWKKSFDQDNIKVFSQQVKGYDVIAFKTTAFIKQNVIDLITVLRDAEGSEKWSANLKHIEYIDEINDLEAIVYELREFPWPLDDRDLVLQYKASLNHDNKSIFVTFHSVKHKKFPKRKNLIRANLYYGAMEFWPKSDGTYVELTILASPKGSIPTWVVNIFQEKVPYQFVIALEEQAKKSKRTPLPGIKALIDQYINLYPLQKFTLK